MMKATERGPNIIFVLADQLRSHGVGCYGNQQVETPHMDRLAREGVRFTNAISTHPVCGPYRGMLMTGNFPTKNGMIQTDHFLRNPDPYFAEVCHAAGYDTAYIGKWHLDGCDREGYIPPERRCGFEYWKALECTHDYFNSKYYCQNETSPRVWREYDAVSQARDACDYVRSQRDRPFCLFLSWGPPHAPYTAPPAYMKRWEEQEVQLRENVNDFDTAKALWESADTQLAAKYQGMRDRHVAFQQERSNAEIFKRYVGYHASIEALDDCLGELLNSLLECDLLDHSIVVFTSDHGDNLGSHRQSAKQMPFEESISIPLLVRYPSVIPPGAVNDELVRPVDMMPTLLSLAGIPCHEVDGDVLDLGEGASEGRDAVLIQKAIALSTNWITNGNGPWAGVRTRRYTYARLTTRNEPWLLYDNVADPYQLTNLVDDPQHADLRDQLDTRTTDLLSEAGESGDPLLYARMLQEERDARGIPDRWADFAPQLEK